MPFFVGGVTGGVTNWGYISVKVGLHFLFFGAQIAEGGNIPLFLNEIKNTPFRCEAKTTPFATYTLIMSCRINVLTLWRGIKEGVIPRKGTAG